MSRWRCEAPVLDAGDATRDCGAAPDDPDAPMLARVGGRLRVLCRAHWNALVRSRWAGTPP